MSIRARSGTPLRDRVAPGAVLTSLALAISTLYAEVAGACPNCIAQSDNRFEFIVTTAFMTALPLLLIGTGLWALRRRLLRMEAEDEEAIRGEGA